jgi:phosphohistidine phosphatase
MTLSVTEHTMDLLLWRHADAEDGSPDAARALTRKGRKQAAEIAAWLRPRLPRDTLVIVSPAIRAQQTAEALGLPFTTVRSIDVHAGVADVVAAADWPHSKTAVLVVGHQPTLGQLAALLLAGEEAEWTVKKGALWWFSNRVRSDETQTVLRAVVSPDLL